VSTANFGVSNPTLLPLDSSTLGSTSQLMILAPKINEINPKMNDKIPIASNDIGP
jgi:hypothetical protein